MKILSFTCVLILLSIVPDTFTDATGLRKKRSLFQTAFKIFKLLPFEASLLNDAIELWNLSLKQSDVATGSLMFQDTQRQLLEHIQRISSSMSDLEKMSQTESVMARLDAFPNILKSELQLYELKSIINQINFAHEKLEDYLMYDDSLRADVNVNRSDSNQRLIPELNSKVESGPSLKQNEDDIENNVFQMSRGFRKRVTRSMRFIEKYTLEDFAAWATGHSSNSLMSLLRKLHNLIVTDNNRGLFHFMKENSKVRFNILNFRKSIGKSNNKNLLRIQRQLNLKNEKIHFFIEN